MLLFPTLSGSGKVSRLEVICLELRPPPVAIHSVRTTAHSFSASGSSVALASAQVGTITGPPPVLLVPAGRLTHSSPAQPVRDEFPLRATYFCQVLPRVRGFPTLRVLCLIRLPMHVRRAFPFTVLLRLPVPLSTPTLRVPA